MSDAAKNQRKRPPDPRVLGSGKIVPERVALSGNRPWRLDDPDLALKVSAGHVDLFALPTADGTPAGARSHLFRVESGGLILGMPSVGGQGQARRIEVLAVGGQDAEALLVDREGLDEPSLVEGWIAALSAAIAVAGAGEARRAEAGTPVELRKGERLNAPMRGSVWLRAERGKIRLMQAPSVTRAGDPPLPLAAETWIEAVGQTSVAVLGVGALSGVELWRAIDRFHALAMLCLERRVTAGAKAESERLDRRARLARAQAGRMLGELARVIVPRRHADAREQDGSDPLLAACQVVGEAMGASVVSPPQRRPEDRTLRRVAEIARASRLRTRRTLLRADWWRHNVGTLIAWYGEARDPVAILPTAQNRYVMVEPASGTRRRVGAALASELAGEAVMLYLPLPSRAISAADLLAFCTRWVRADAARILFAGLAMGGFTVAAPLITEVLIDSVIPRTELDQLAFCAAALVMVALGTAGFQAVQAIAMLRIEGRLDLTLQAALLDRLLRLPVAFFRHYTVGDLADRTLGIGAMRQVLTGRTIRGLLAGLFCLFSFALMFYFDVRLALVASALTAVRGAVIVATSAVRLRHERRHFDLQGKVGGLVLQFLTGIGKLRVAGAKVRALEVWARRFAEQKRHFVASQRAANLLTVAELGFPAAASLVIFAAAEVDPAGNFLLDTGRFLAFFAAFGQSLAAVGEFSAALAESLIAVPYFTRVRPLLAAPVEISEERKPPGELSGAFELGQVTFRYLEDGPTVLDKVSIRVEKGEYVALVGASGSGKSTIFRLLLGFEKPESGAVFYDGKSLDTLDVSAVRRQIGVVLQNGKLTSGSIFENICGGVQLPIEEAWQAARLAGLDADIEAMPMGMHTIIAEGLSTFSGGQRQRLMIARALVHRPRLLLFDEATSALDNLTQSIVSASLATLNVTRVVIAHRLSTVEHADRIIVLAQGQVVQSGSFAELSAAPGPFADFAKRQLL